MVRTRDLEIFVAGLQSLALPLSYRSDKQAEKPFPLGHENLGYLGRFRGAKIMNELVCVRGLALNLGDQYQN